MAAGLTVKIKGDASHFDKTLKSVKGGISGIKTPLTAVAGAVAAVGAAIGAAAVGAYKLTESLVNAGEAARREDAVLGNVVKRMGLFGTGAEKITEKMIKYADATELATGIDAGIIKSTQAKLSTFEEVAKTAGDVGGAFDRATKAALDMSIVFGGDASQYAVQLGKALQDPEKGLAALKKTGALTRVDIERIGAEFASSGNKAKAFDQILSAIERQVGGAAEAAATGTSRIRGAFNQMRDELAIPVSEQFDKLAETISKQTPAIVEGFKAIAPQIAAAFNTIFTAIGEAMQGNMERLFALGQFVGDTIVIGMKQAFIAGTATLADEIASFNNPLVKGLFQASKLAGFDIDKRSGGAGSRIAQSAVSDLAVRYQDFMKQYAPPLQPAQPFAYKSEGVITDSAAVRLEVLLQSIDRKLNPTPFPAR